MKLVLLLVLSFIFHICSKNNTPEQVRISLTGLKPSQYSIMWQSNDTRINSPSIIQWGYSSKKLEYQQYGNKKIYTACTVYKSVAHEVLISTEKNKFVYYRLSNDENGPWTEIFHFKSQKEGSFKFISFGDSDTRTTNGKKIISNLNKIKYGYDLIIHAGDYAYDTPSMQYRWDDWGNSFHNITSSIPYMYSVGNHEQHCDSKFENYNERFSKVPGKLSGGGNYYYSFDYSYAHFIMLAPYEILMNYTRGSVQYKWLEKDLKTVNRSKTRWIIVTYHFPAYSSNARYSENIKLRRSLEPLFYEYGVDLIINGHVHSYERSCSVFNDKCDDKAPMHIILGTAGRVLYDTWRLKPIWSAHREGSHGIGLFDVEATTLKFQYIRMNGTVGDSAILKKKGIN
eukprot:gene3197-5513_t